MNQENTRRSRAGASPRVASPAGRTSRRGVVSVALALVGIVGAIVLWHTRRAAPTVVAEAEETVEKVVVPAAPKLALTPPRTPRQLIDPDKVPGASYGAALAMFREYSKYPPNSRPANESFQDIAEPGQIATAEQALPAGTDAQGRPKPSRVLCSMQPARHTVAKGKTQQVTLSCRRGSQYEAPEGMPLALAIEGLSAELLSGPNRAGVALGGATFVDDGTAGDMAAGDRVYTLSMPIPDGVAGMVGLNAQIKVVDRQQDDPQDAQPVTARFQIAREAPARFTGQVRDRVVDGSLVVLVELDIQKAGRYRVFANVEQAGRLVAYAKEDRELQAGRQNVELLFFGKILREAGVEGPLTVTHLRGQYFNLESNDDVIADPLETVVRAHETRPYSSLDFSDKEWDSAYKRERLAELTALAGSGS